jgi:hypothetical protein
VAGVRGLGFGIEGGFGFKGVVTAALAFQTVAKPRGAAEPAEGAMELAAISARGARLVGAGHH